MTRPTHVTVVPIAIFGLAVFSPLHSQAPAGGPQDVISAKAGLVYFVLGRVSIVGGDELASGSQNRQLNKGEILFSEAGRAEVLLNAGTVLRIGEMARLRMDNVELADTRVSIEAGSAVVTVSQIPKLARVAIHIGGVVVAMKSVGVYRFDAGHVDTGHVDANVPLLRVFKGQAEASLEGGTMKAIVNRGRAVSRQDLLISNFHLSDVDALQQWAEIRNPPPPLVPLPPMICLSEPKGMAELNDYIKACLHPPAWTSVVPPAGR